MAGADLKHLVKLRRADRILAPAILVILASSSFLFFVSVPPARAQPPPMTYTSDTTLRGDVFCSDVTINPGVTVTTDGYDFFCTGQFTNYGRIVTGFPENGGPAVTGTPPTLFYGNPGGSVPSSYGGSGGSGDTSCCGGDAYLGGVGGNTIALGGQVAPFNGDCQSTDCRGASATAPTLDLPLIQLWYVDGFQNYMEGAGGGSGSPGIVDGPGPGTSGAYGVYIQAASIHAGVIYAAGAAMSQLTSTTNCGGGGGGGVVILAYNSSLTEGTYYVNGGSSINSQCESQGYLQDGGAGQVLRFNYGSSPPITGSQITLSSSISTTTTTTTTTSTMTTTQIVIPTGMNVTVTGYSANGGTSVIISSMYLGTSQPAGTGSIGLTAMGFFDVHVTGIADGTARVCIFSTQVDSATQLQYYYSGSWNSATNVVATPGSMICGDIPVADLTGTPIAMGDPPAGIPAFPLPYGLVLVLVASLLLYGLTRWAKIGFKTTTSMGSR